MRPLNLLIVALVLASCLQPAASLAADERPEQQAAFDAVAAVAAGESRCDTDAEDRIVYLGPTDASLVTCLARFANQRDRTLIISSGGGDALLAIEAAELVAGLGWSAVVRGMCASSCANYVLPAMKRLTVEPYSAVLLHGGPVDEASLVALVQREVEKQQRAAYPDVTDSVLAQGRGVAETVARAVYAAHQRFAKARQVDPRWYDLDDFPEPRDGYGPLGFAIADPAFTAQSLPETEICSYWFPSSPEDRIALGGVLEGTQLAYRVGV